MAGRRRGPGQELKDFSTAFTQGYKIFADADRYGSGTGRGRSSDPYSDDNLAKGDPRLGKQGFLGKLFGGEDTSLSGADRGRAAIDQQMRIALERGDVTKYKQLLKDSAEFETLAKHSPVGEKPGEAPSAAKPITGSPRADAESAIPEPPSRKAAFGDGEPKDTLASNDQTDPATGRDPIDLNTPTADMQQASNEPVTGPGDPNDTFSPSGGADWSSLFSSNGGMVPTRYAAIGGPIEASTPDPVKQAIPLSAPSMGGEAPEDDTPPEEPEAEPANNQHEGKNLNLSSDPQELAAQAAPAVKAGLDRLNEEFKPRGAVGQDPEYRSRIAAFANGDGRLSDDDVAQIDRTIDPDNTMSPSLKTPARIAAIHKFFTEEGKPEVGNEMVARLLLYNKYMSQQHGAEAVRAFESGDIEGGAKALSAAYENDPDAQSLKPKVNPDKTIDYELGYDGAGGFIRTGGGKATQEQYIQLASDTARGSEYMQRLHDGQAALKQLETQRSGKGKAAAAPSPRLAAGMKAFDTEWDGKSEPAPPQRMSNEEYGKLPTHDRVAYDNAYKLAAKTYTDRRKEWAEKTDAADRGTSYTSHGKAMDDRVDALKDLKDARDAAQDVKAPGYFDSDGEEKKAVAAKKQAAAEDAYSRGWYQTRSQLIAKSDLKGKEADQQMIDWGFERPSALPSRKAAGYGNRADGTEKGDGFFGPITRPDGKVSTELSAGVTINGKEMEIPLMVPTLTKPELDYLIKNDPSSPEFKKNLPPAIFDKAVKFAQDRVKNNQSPFATKGERFPIPGEPPTSAVPPAGARPNTPPPAATPPAPASAPAPAPAPAPQPPAAPQPAASAPPQRVMTKDQFDQLPKGTRFIAPDNKIRIKQ